MTHHPEYPGESPHDGKIAIIDIGSNSIRLVVYDGLKRAPIPLYNEKSMCALGKGIALTGRLNPEGVAMAKHALARFLAMVRVMDVVELHVLATAAVRDAKDGPEFVEDIEREFTLAVTVISGQKEAQLAAGGIYESVHAPRGIAGDLGGGSIELIGLAPEGTGEQATLPIGPLRILDESRGDAAKMRKLIDQHLGELRWLKKQPFENFYAIGGSFRALAKMHMAKVKYPLSILHHYQVSAEEMLGFARHITTLEPHEIAALPGAPGKRAASLRPAAMALETVLKTTRCQQVIFSGSGIREGYLYGRLSPHLRREDALIAASAEMVRAHSRHRPYTRDLFQWMAPLFPKENESWRRLRFAACILSELGELIHPDYRAEWAFHRVLYSALVGISHAERVALALALYHRYQFKCKESWPALTLLDEPGRRWARVVGAASMLAYHLSGGVAGGLHHLPLALEKGKISLTLAGEYQDLAGDAVKKRLDGLGEAWSAFASISM